MATKSGNPDSLDFCLFKSALLILGYAINTSSFSDNWLKSSKTTYQRYTEITNSLSSLLFDRVHWTMHCWWGTNTTMNMCVAEGPWPSRIGMLKIMCMCQHFQTLWPLCIWYLLYFALYIANFVLKKCIIISKLLK